MSQGGEVENLIDLRSSDNVVQYIVGNANLRFREVIDEVGQAIYDNVAIVGGCL